jgi:hypothetical protein
MDVGDGNGSGSATDTLCQRASNSFWMTAFGAEGHFGLEMNRFGCRCAKNEPRWLLSLGLDGCFCFLSRLSFSVLARTPPPSSKKVLQSQALRDRPRFLLFVWKKEHLFAYTALELFACSQSAGIYERKI